MAWSPCPLKRFPGARQPDHRLPACSHRFQAITPRVTRVRFTPTTTRNTRHVHRTHHFYRLAAALHRYLPILRKFPLFLFFFLFLSLSLRFSFLALTFLQTILSLTQPFAPRSHPLLSPSYLPNNHRTNPREFLFPSRKDLAYPFPRFTFSSLRFSAPSPPPPSPLPPPSSSFRHAVFPYRRSLFLLLFFLLRRFLFLLRPLNDTFHRRDTIHQFTLAPIFYLTLAPTS